MAAADFLLQQIDLAREKFHRTSALGAHHVVMAAAIVLVLVTGDAIVEGDFAGQSTLGQQFQRAIDSGVADASVLLVDKAMKFVRRKVIASFEKGAQNAVALRGLLEADALEMAVQDGLRFTHHLARDRRLIIDALLQHAISQDTIGHWREPVPGCAVLS